MAFNAPQQYPGSSLTPTGAGGFNPPIPDLGQQQQPEEKPSVGGFVKNIGSSALGLGEGIGNAVIHPINTLKTVSQIGIGGVEKLIPGQQGSEKVFDAAVNYFKQRYGSFDAVKSTAYKDPLGFALDLSTALSGVGGIVGKVGELSDISKVADAGKAISDAGDIIDPLKAIGKVAAPVVSKTADSATELAKGYLGFRTGAGSKAIKEAYKAGQTGDASYLQALRGNTSPEEILQKAKDAAAELQDTKTANYEAGLQKLQDETMTTKNGQLYVKKPVSALDIQTGKAAPETLGKEGTWVPTDLSLKGLKNVTTTTLKDFNIGAKGTELDFSKTPLPSTHTNDLKELVDRVYKWDDITPKGVNDLRKVIDSYKRGGLAMSSADKQYNAVLGSMRNNISTYLGDRVPQIREMNTAYHTAQSNIDEITKGLSLNTANPETAMNKLKGALRDNNEFKQQLVQRLQDDSGMNLEQMIAGYALSSGVPKGSVARLVPGSEVMIAAYAHNPLIALDALSSSPRAVGEIVRLLGMGSKHLERLGDLIGQYKLQNYVPSAKVTTEAGKLKEVTSQP